LGGVLVVTERVRDSSSKGLTLGSTTDGFHSCEVHSEFRIQNKSKVLKLETSRIGYEQGSEVGKGEYTRNGGMVGLGWC